MRKPWLVWLVVLAGCPDVSKNNDPSVAYVEFDPANSIIPFPNNLVLDPATGKVNLPAQACESAASAAVRTGVLNKLDGFGTFETGLQITLTEPADMTTVDGNIVLYARAHGTTAINPIGATPVPLKPILGTTLRFDPNNCASPATVDAITVVPLVPLDPNTTYSVAVLGGLKAASGADYHASFTWGLVRQAVEPVMLDSTGAVIVNRTPIPNPTSSTDPNLAALQGIDLLWHAHAAALAFLAGTGAVSVDRTNVLVAWDFTTQTTTAPLDPAVAGSPAATLSGIALLGTTSVATAKGVPCTAGLGCTNIFNFALGAGACNQLPCTKVGDVIGAGLTTQPFQVPGPNAFAPSLTIPGPWSDPVAPTAQAGVVLQVLAFVPSGTPPTAAGWPTVVFGHGLGSSKESLFAIAAQLANIGFASVAIDFQDHGSRAVPTSNDPALGCAGTCFTIGGTNTGTACDTLTACAGTDVCVGAAGVVEPTNTQQCYAPFLSPDLGTTRDNIRQTVLDLQRLVRALKACGASGCTSNNDNTTLAIDADHIVYAGISLGGIIGSTTFSLVPDLKAAVLNVPGMGWLDILENTANLTIRCSLVNSLIDAGIVTGTKWDPSNPTVGLCTTDAWKADPGYIQFSGIGRWVLDPADGANFAFKLAPKKFVIQEVVGDQVVPNIATDDEGALTGQTPLTADPFTPVTTTASAAITTMPTASKWVRYPTLPSTDPTTGGYGNAFEHPSLLRPAAVTPGHCSNDAATTCGMSSDCGGINVCIFPGVLGTARLQTDALTFLFVNH